MDYIFLKRILFTIISFFAPIIEIVLLRAALIIWTKMRNIDLDEYTMNIQSIKNRFKFNVKYSIIILIPCLFVLAINIFTLLFVINEYSFISFNIIKFIIIALFSTCVSICNFIFYKKIVDYRNYKELCAKYNIVDEKIWFDVLVALEIVFFAFSLYVSMSVLLFN